jgi:hypothetical protein
MLTMWKAHSTSQLVEKWTAYENLVSEVFFRPSGRRKKDLLAVVGIGNWRCRQDIYRSDRADSKGKFFVYTEIHAGCLKALARLGC